MKYFLLFAIALLNLRAADEPAVTIDLAPGQLQAVPSFEACSYYFLSPTSGQPPFGVEYRPQGETAWRTGFAPVSDLPAGIWKGSLFDLPEDSAWVLRVIDARGAEVIAPVVFRTWTSQPRIGKVVDLSQVPGAERGLVVTAQGTADSWIKYTAPAGWKLTHAPEADDLQPGAITVRNARYVIFENLTVMGGTRHGIAIEESESVRVLNCDIAGWGRVGEQQYGGDGPASRRGKYQDAKGELINLDAGVAITRSRNTVVERCYVHDPRHRANSWQYSHPAGPSAIFVNATRGGTVLRWNDCIGSDEHRWNDVIEASSNNSPLGGFFRDSDISGNFLAFGNDDGVELEGGGMNVRFYRNKIEGTLCGVSTGACLLGPQFIHGNLIVNPGDETGLALMFFKNSHGVPQGGKRHHLNNTLYGTASSAYGGYGKPAGSGRLGFLRNNIFWANDARLPGEASRRDDFDGDLFWLTNDARVSEAFLAGLRRIGQENHGEVADPRFVAPAEGDFHLAAGSPARATALAVPNLVVAGANRGAFSDDTTEVPFRPLALQALPRQLTFSAPESRRTMQVRVSLPASAPAAVPFEVRQNRVFDWFVVQPASGAVAPGQTVTLTVTIDSSALHGRPSFKGAFLVRTPSGLSRPVSVYAAAEFVEDLRPAGAPETAYVEAAAAPALAGLVRATKAPGVFGGKYVAFASDGQTPELHTMFEVSRPGGYAVLLRSSIDGATMKRRDVELTVDDGAPLPAAIEPDYQWNTGATHFRAVFLRSLGELQPGRHDLRLTVRGGLNLNEVIITQTPAAFLADGWHQLPH